MNLENLEYYVWLSKMKNLTFEMLQLLLKKYHSLNKLWNLSVSELEKNYYLSRSAYCDLRNSEYKCNLNSYVEYMINKKIKIIPYNDNKYPTRLHYINNKPKVLFVKGNIESINNKSVGIVGSRNCTLYGEKNARYFSSVIARRNTNIISGLAKGIDAIAHSSAIDAKGITLAVIGNGLDIIYPKENIKLANRILENEGAIISEYPIGTKPLAENFPLRNRIISGLSDAVIVIEATKNSGSLITANYAVDQGKEVWAIPGNIDSNNYIGNNELIKDGANILTDINDLYFSKWY